jgi:hypothetical protein
MNGLGMSSAKQNSLDESAPTDPTYYVADGVNDSIKGDAVTPYIWSDIATQDLSISLWVRIDASSKKNLMPFTLSELNDNTDNAMYIYYQASHNRLFFKQRFGGSSMERGYSLNFPNQEKTGILSLSSGWNSGKRGFTNVEGFTNITITFDASSGPNGIKMFWNGAELTASIINNTSNPKTNWNPTYLRIADNASNTGSTASAFDGAINEIKLYNRVLSSSEVSSLYNFGDIANADVLNIQSGLITEWGLEDETDKSGKYNSNPEGGTFV